VRPVGLALVFLTIGGRMVLILSFGNKRLLSFITRRDAACGWLVHVIVPEPDMCEILLAGLEFGLIGAACLVALLLDPIVRVFDVLGEV
jgi:hypothetical protein